MPPPHTEGEVVSGKSDQVLSPEAVVSSSLLGPLLYLPHGEHI